MRNGDLSNATAPRVAFNIDSLLFKDAKGGLISNLKSYFTSDVDAYLKREFDWKFISVMEKIWGKYNLSITLVTFKPFHDDVEDYLREKNVAFTSLEYFSSMDDLRMRVLNNYLYYFDSDENLLSMIGYDNAIQYKEIGKVLGF